MPYVYHTTGLGPFNYIRSCGVPLFQCIDDRNIDQHRLQKCYPFEWSDLAKAAVFISTLFLALRGYFIGLKMFALLPTQRIAFLGFNSDFEKQAFFLSEDKRKNLPLSEKLSSTRNKFLSRPCKDWPAKQFYLL